MTNKSALDRRWASESRGGQRMAVRHATLSKIPAKFWLETSPVWHRRMVDEMLNFYSARLLAWPISERDRFPEFVARFVTIQTLHCDTKTFNWPSTPDDGDALLTAANEHWFVVETLCVSVRLLFVVSVFYVVFVTTPISVSRTRSPSSCKC